MPPARLRRFGRLERPRAQGGPPAGAGGPLAPGRFEAVEGPGAVPAAPLGAGPDPARFSPDPEPPLELAPVDGRRPFVRCARCGMDASAFAARCEGCGARLDTPEQRAFDECFFAARDAEAEREALAGGERAAALAREAAEAAASRRLLGEALAREVGDRERRRLEVEGIGGGLVPGRASGLLRALAGWAARLLPPRGPRPPPDGGGRAP